MTKYTEGPWKIDNGPCRDYAVPIGNATGHQIAGVFTEHPTDETDEESANIILISKAPELLVELEKATWVILEALQNGEIYELLEDNGVSIRRNLVLISTAKGLT